MFLEHRLERLIAKLKRSATIPLRLELWNGRAFDLASEPKVKIGVPSPSALRFLVSPDLMKLMLKPGERFLDIGCGWGALVLHAAKKYGARATGVTLSRNQYEFALRRIREEGLEGRCEVRLQDYRDIPGEGVFDKIASVGM